MTISSSISCLGYYCFTIPLHCLNNSFSSSSSAATDPLSKFIIVRLEYNDNDNPSNILNRSAGFCKMAAKWEFNMVVDLVADQVCQSFWGYGQFAVQQRILFNLILTYNTFPIKDNADSTVECSIRVDDILVASETGSDRKEAKDSAATKAIQELERRCYTILVKNKYTSGDGSMVNATTLETTG